MRHSLQIVNVTEFVILSEAKDLLLALNNRSFASLSMTIRERSKGEILKPEFRDPARYRRAIPIVFFAELLV